MFNLYVYEHFTYWKITPAISRKVISVKKNFQLKFQRIYKIDVSDTPPTWSILEHAGQVQ